MSKLILQGNLSGTGNFTISAPISNTDRSLDLPDSGGTVVLDIASQTLTNKVIQGGTLTVMTANSPASGNTIDFNSIPSWARRITVVFGAVSVAAVAGFRVRLGTSSGVVSSGYSGAQVIFSTAPATTFTPLNTSPEGIAGVGLSGNTTTVDGTVTILNPSGNTWVATGTYVRNTDNIAVISSGSITLSSVLDRVSIITTASTFDAGVINVIYEG